MIRFSCFRRTLKLNECEPYQMLRLRSREKRMAGSPSPLCWCVGRCLRFVCWPLALVVGATRAAPAAAVEFDFSAGPSTDSTFSVRERRNTINGRRCYRQRRDAECCQTGPRQPPRAKTHSRELIHENRANGAPTHPRRAAYSQARSSAAEPSRRKARHKILLAIQLNAR